MDEGIDGGQGEVLVICFPIWLGFLHYSSPMVQTSRTHQENRVPLLNMFNFKDDTDFVFKPEVYVYSTKTLHVWNSNLTKNKVGGLIINVSIKTSNTFINIQSLKEQ